jgi:hypothetical protein
MAEYRRPQVHCRSTHHAAHNPTDRLPLPPPHRIVDKARASAHAPPVVARGRQADPLNELAVLRLIGAGRDRLLGDVSTLSVFLNQFARCIIPPRFVSSEAEACVMMPHDYSVRRPQCLSSPIAC